MGLLYAAGICDLSTHSRVKFRENHDGATGFVQNQLPSSKKALKVEAVMEEHPHIIERVHLYIQPNSLCKDREEYISRAVMNVGEKVNLLDTRKSQH